MRELINYYHYLLVTKQFDTLYLSYISFYEDLKNEDNNIIMSFDMFKEFILFYKNNYEEFND